MKLKVKRAFYDSKHKNQLRVPGMNYEEPNQKRADDLIAGGFVVGIAPPIEQPVGKRPTETKNKPRKRTTKKTK